MRIIRKMVIIILMVVWITIPVGAWTIPSTYTQSLFELRGSWVSTVGNLDFERQTSIEQYKANYLRVLDTFEEFHMNAVFFQVRPTNDAFYQSTLNPWSRYLIGSEGKDPGWDPMEWMVEVTHERGMEFHAWLNPYRASLDVFSQTVDSYLLGLSGSSRDQYLQKYMDELYKPQLQNALSSMDEMNFAKKNPDLLIQGGVRILLNPGLATVRNFIYDTINEIITQYEVDGIHFDDYFYNDVSLDSDKQLFLQQTQATEYVVADHKNWRRANVDALIEGIHNRIEVFNIGKDHQVQFGISPAGGWAPAISDTCAASGYGMEGGMEGFPCNGYSSYHDLYADTRKWVQEEWIDYILPQNYYELGRYHEVITDWWNQTVEGTSVRLYMGLGPFKFNEYSYLTEDEYINQLRFDEQYENVSGYVLFSYRNLSNATSNKMINSNDKIKAYWTRTSLLPALLDDSAFSPVISTVAEQYRKNQQTVIKLNTNEVNAGYAIYRVGYQDPLIMNEDNVYRLIPNTGDTVTIYDTVDNELTYTYYIKPISKSGVLGDDYQTVDFATSFINQSPLIISFDLPGSNVYAVGNSIHIEGEVQDNDADELIVELFYAFDRIRYRWSYILELDSNCFSFDFNIPNNLSDEAHFKLEVRDATDTTTTLSKTFYIVGDEVGFLERQMYVVTKELEKAFNNILVFGD
ncbi:MAG: family 10 glycosylhydrolase [Bacilli bacterium]